MVVIAKGNVCDHLNLVRSEDEKQLISRKFHSKHSVTSINKYSLIKSTVALYILCCPCTDVEFSRKI
jgi:hypothetical protein